MNSKYQHLASPITIGSVTIKNRMFMAPMDTGFGNNEYGGFTQAGIDYFVRRAEGGFGLLFSGGTNGDCIVDGCDGILNHPDEFIEQGKQLNERIAKFGTKMFIQLSMNVGRNGGLKTPSPLPTLGNPDVTTVALTVEEIHTKVREMGKAAKLVKDAGFAGVDIHALHWGHLLDSFALSVMNHREDEYGGSLENRLRIAKEIIDAIRQECGMDFPVTMRLALKSYMKGFNKASFDGSDEVGRTLEEAIEISKLLESYGYDALSVDAGTLDAFYYAMPPSYIPAGFMLDLTRKVKEAVSIPVLCGGRMADPNISEKAIAEGIIDAAVIGRQAIADPDFAKLVTEGRTDEIRTCIGCNQGCIWGFFCNGRVSCAVNPEVGFEGNTQLKKAENPKKVIVVGGGIAGMEAARIVKKRGHNVTLIEKSGTLGGNLIPAGAHDFKIEINQLANYYKRQMELLCIDIQMNAEATPEMLRQAGADTIILATGSVPVMPRSIEGIEKAVSGVDALLGKKPVGRKVVVVGGGLVGCEIAYGYAKEGRDVTIVEALDQILNLGSVPIMNKTMLLDGFEYYGTTIYTSTKLKSVLDDGAIVVLPDGKEKKLDADTVILSIGYRPVPSLKEKLSGCDAEIIEIGDGRQVGNVLTCVKDAYEAACKI
ncbi:MAG: FAD-dependent oxidoreductase [Bacteroidaceae bacterium]|nr:FAD-dependent oxidoreductase [Bacteroidaceae bacterium]